jgi:hypothetical protein
MAWNNAQSNCLLKELDSTMIKNESKLDKLIEYLKRNTPYIPCYAIRKELGIHTSLDKKELPILSI